MKNLSLFIPALALFSSTALADTCTISFPTCDNMGYTETRGSCVGKYTVCPSDPNKVTCIDGPSIGSLKYSLQTSNHKGWLLCNGQSVSKDTYPLLFNILGTDFGGSGTNFNLPDYRGIFLRGYNSAYNGYIYYGYSTNSAIKTVQKEELPNLTGTMTLDSNAKDSGHLTGAFSMNTDDCGSWSADAGGSANPVIFSAKNANTIYTDSGHVIPANYAANIFIYAGQ